MSSNGKKALIIGINYTGNNRLYGCVNDATNFAVFLNGKGYNVILLIEPTKEKILESFECILKCESIYIHFSGHGKYINHKPAIISSDNKYITQDEILDFLDRLDHGTKVRISLDCCVNFPLSWNLKPGGNARPQFVLNHMENTAEIGRDIIILSGTGTTYDTIINGKRTGVLTYNLLKTLEERDRIRCNKLLEIMIVRMKDTGSFPSIFFGRKMDTTEVYI
jgi:hypothetical protein